MKRVLIALLTTCLAFGSITVVNLNTAEAAKVPEGYRPSVIDIESPLVVEARAKKVLGSRFIDLWVGNNEKTYVLGVLNLKPAEEIKFRKAIAGKAPITLVKRTVSREKLDAVLKTVELTATAPNSDANEVWADYDSGTVVVQVGKKSRSIELMKSNLSKGFKARKQTATQSSGVDPYVIPTVTNGIPKVLVTAGEATTQYESKSASPYRAGKNVGVGRKAASCTTSFLVRKGQTKYGLTAGHCGKNGSQVWFAGKRQGNIQNNTLWATKQAIGDASIFKLTSNSAASLYRSSSLNQRVSGSYAMTEIKKGTRVCARGSFSNTQICGDVFATNVLDTSDSKKAVRYIYKFRWNFGASLIPGDSGSPIYRVLSNGTVKAVGVLRGGSPGAAGLFKQGLYTPIRIVTAQTGTTLVLS